MASNRSIKFIFIIPFNEIPLRGTFAVQISDHIDNYKLNSFDELKWVFRLSLGF